jgi:hypothetical protein
MTICQQILHLLENEPGGEEKAMRLILQNEQFKKAAFLAHRKYAAIHALADWEDVMYDAVVRFVEMIRRGKKPEKDCLVSFRTICRNICSEYRRAQKRPAWWMIEELDIPKDLIPSMSQSRAEKLMSYFAQLRQTCQILLEAKFLWVPPENDNEALSELVGGVPKASAVPTTITRCKEDLEKIIGDNRNDLLNT